MKQRRLLYYPLLEHCPSLINTGKIQFLNIPKSKIFSNSTVLISNPNIFALSLMTTILLFFGGTTASTMLSEYNTDKSFNYKKMDRFKRSYDYRNTINAPPNKLLFTSPEGYGEKKEIEQVDNRDNMPMEQRQRKCKFRRECLKLLKQRESLARDIVREQLHKIVQEEVKLQVRTLQISSPAQCPAHYNFNNTTIKNRAPTCEQASNSGRLKEGILTPKITSAFHCRLQNYITIAKKTLLELKTFRTPFSSGAFNRGQGMDLLNGRFVAQTKGIYHFICYVHVIHKPGKKKRILKQSDNIRLLICLNSQCRAHSNSLEFISGFESSSKIFTIGVSGLLQMQAGEYASVFIDNRARFPITIQKGSHFNGILLGT